ncbi:MAG: hypothetical protein NTV14_01420 [Coprothermobacterota bacterium]|nr:hypothetical protein [Coprothermobacterota bacterium]
MRPENQKVIAIPGIGAIPWTIGFPGTAAPQCGKSGIGTVPGIETSPWTIGFPGTAAPQCGISSEVTEDTRSGEQPIRGWRPYAYLLHFDA